MALKITESKPKMMINLLPILMLGGASQTVMSHSPSAASFNGKEIQFDFAGEEISIGPIKDINFFLDNVTSGDEGATTLCKSVVSALEAYLESSGIETPAPHPQHQPGVQPAEGFNNLLNPSTPPVVRAQTDDPTMRLYDYVPGTSESNYRAVGRTESVLISAKLGNEKSGSIRIEVLPGHEFDPEELKTLGKFGMSPKNGKNSSGTHCAYTSLHGGISDDDVATMIDLLGTILSRFGMSLPPKITLEDLAP